MADLYLHGSPLDASVEKVIAKGVFGITSKLVPIGDWSGLTPPRSARWHAASTASTATGNCLARRWSERNSPGRRSHHCRYWLDMSQPLGNQLAADFLVIDLILRWPAIMDAGYIVESRAPLQLLGAPQTPVTLAMVQAVPQLKTVARV
jgi:hypothetical protein